MVIRMVIRMVSRMVIRMVSRMVILWLYGVLEGPHYPCIGNRSTGMGNATIRYPSNSTHQQRMATGEILPEGVRYPTGDTPRHRLQIRSYHMPMLPDQCTSDKSL